MSTEVIMPALGMAQETGKVLSWRKREGDAVVKGEPLMEIETDKVTVEIEAPASGILAGVTVATGDDVPVGRVVAVIREADDAATAVTGATSAAPTPASPLPERPAATPVAARIATEHALDLRLVAPSGDRIRKDDVLAHLETSQALPAAQVTGRVPGRVPVERVPASPRARRLAAERGLDLASLWGTGPGGAILAADVLSAPVLHVPAAAPHDVAAAAPATGELATGELATGELATGESATGEPAAGEPRRDPARTPDLGMTAEGDGDGEVIHPSGAGRLMAQRTAQSFREAPHFYLTRELLAGRLIEARERLLPTIEARAGVRLSFTDLLIRILAQALVEHPLCNASWRDGAIRMSPRVDLGVAAATPQGLLVPVIRDAAGKTLAAIARERADLAGRAVAGTLTPGDLAGGTATLSNLGMYDVDMFQAILNPPQSLILAVGRIAERPVARNGQIVAAPTVWVTGSFDHRIHDGARAAEFLRTVASYVEEPLGLL